MAQQILHLEFNGKSARVNFQGLPDLRPKPTVTLSTAAGPVTQVRVTNGLNPRVDTAQLRGDILIQGDPEIDFATAGQILDVDQLTTTYYDPSVPEPQPVTDFRELDIVYDAFGNEKERRPHSNRRPNLNELQPVKVGKRIPLAQALVQFVFRFNYQILHNDSLTRDFLHDIARELHQKQEVALLGAGAKGTLPLVIRERGSPYRAFLYGEVGEDETAKDRYKLLMLLSDMELKRPPHAASGTP
ncbi:MAG: hypothetical protein SFY80_16985 [Verrucomicrobiota bacterium]|nr:hypothetical protein [Verrucomicrobiota bacterium]